MNSPTRGLAEGDCRGDGDCLGEVLGEDGHACGSSLKSNTDMSLECERDDRCLVIFIVIGDTVSALSYTK